jgi:hypothetical protein
MFARSSSRAEYNRAKQLLLAKFEVAMLDGDFLDRLKNWEPYSKTYSHKVKGNIQWVVCRYHPSVVYPLTAALHECKLKWCKRGFAPPFEFRICWSKAGKNLAEDVAFVQSF